MRYLFRAALCGVIAAANPVSAAVVVAGAGGDVPIKLGVDPAARAFPLAASPDAYALLTRDVGAERGPGSFPIVPAGDASADIATLPEPASWGLMILGFGGLSFALRRRARVGERIRFS